MKVSSEVPASSSSEADEDIGCNEDLGAGSSQSSLRAFEESKTAQNQRYDDEWDREVARRLKIQDANQAYINKHLSNTLN